MSEMAKKEIVLERDIEAKLVREVKRRGGLTYKFSSPGCTGVPDRIIIVPDKYYPRVVFVELKTKNGTLKRNQVNQIHLMRDKGAEVHVTYGVEQMMALITELFPGPAPGRKPRVPKELPELDTQPVG